MTAALNRGRWFVGAWTGVIAVMVSPVLIPGLEPVVFAPTALLIMVVIAASLCVVSSAWLIAVAHRHDLAELGFVAQWFMVLSLLPVVHGLTTPGVLYSPNAAFTASVYIAGPIAAATVLPTLFPRQAWAIRVARHWRSWSAFWTLGTAVIAVWMLVEPDLVRTPPMGSTTAVLGAVPSVGLAMLYSWRHLTMAAISGSKRYLVVFAGFVMSGVSQLVWVTSVAFGPTFWFAHFFDIIGVFAGTIGGAIVYWRAGRPSELVGPIIEADPLVALDLSLDPAVSRFIADLDAKDPITRDHVLRTAEAAMQVAVMLRLSPAEVRDTGVGAVLHDIGKLEIPESILNKPGKLDAEEYDLMKTHPAIGAGLLANNPALRPVADVVRAHHERIDGAGYPDGLADAEIPVPARIVAVCDAYDAMAHDRPYRQGMGPAKALSILREHSGTQWDGAVVEAFAELVEAGLVRTSPTTLDHLGRDSDLAGWSERRPIDDAACGCLEAVPHEVADELLEAWVGKPR